MERAAEMAYFIVALLYKMTGCPVAALEIIVNHSANINILQRSVEHNNGNITIVNCFEVIIVHTF